MSHLQNASSALEVGDPLSLKADLDLYLLVSRSHRFGVLLHIPVLQPAGRDYCLISSTNCLQLYFFLYFLILDTWTKDYHVSICNLRCSIYRVMIVCHGK